MEPETIAVYEDKATEWARRRGGATDELGGSFRVGLGAGPVLDAGCGTGRYLAQLGPEVVGLDATAAFLDIARSHSVPLVRADLEALPFAEGAFAGIFARHSYLHLPKDRVAGALAEAHRVLRPGGELLVSLIEGSYCGRRLPDDDFPGRWFSLYEKEELESVLRLASFEVLSLTRRPYRGGGGDLVARCRRPTRPRRAGDVGRDVP